MTTQIAAPLLANAAETARLMGCSVATVKRLAEKGELPIVRFGPRGHVRFRLRDIEDFIERKQEEDD
jgi:excisionase family DNA binding protein